MDSAGQSKEPHLAFSRMAWILPAAISVMLMLAVFRLLPGSLPDVHAYTSDAAYAQCLHNSQDLGRTTCINIGFPDGAARPFGLPISWVASKIFGHDGAITLGEIKAVYAGFVLLAFALASLFFFRLTDNRLLGVFGALLFFVSPVVSGQAGYGALLIGMALIPGYFLIDQQLERVFRDGRADLIALTALLVILVRAFALFLDGYTFVMSSLLGLTFFCVGLLRRETAACSFQAIVVYVTGCAAAYLAYRRYIPGAEFGTMPIDFFRAAGVDIATILFPMQGQHWLYDLLHVGMQVKSRMIYGDGTNLLGVFVGYASLIAALLFGLALLRRRLRWSRALVTIVGVGTIALVLSLGPSLKYKDFRTESRAAELTFQDYMMPKQATSLDLGTDWIYLHVPGISNIRALGRWQVLTRLAWIVILLMVLALLRRSEHKKWALALAVLALAETLPNPAAAISAGREQYARAYDLYYRYASLFGEKLHPQERVLLLQLHDGASYNEYFADTLCARANVYCYNAGGDKTLALIEGQWPREILEIRRRHNIAGNLAGAFRKHLVDVVVVPHFDLRNVIYSPTSAHASPGVLASRIAELADALGADVQSNEEFSFLRQRADVAGLENAGLPAAECGIDCWPAWPAAENEAGIKWGPAGGMFGHHFNPQPSGWSALWVGVDDPDGRYAIAFGDELIPTMGGNKIIVGRMPDTLEARLVIGGVYPVSLIDLKDRTVIRLGDFKISR